MREPALVLFCVVLKEAFNNLSHAVDVLEVVALHSHHARVVHAVRVHAAHHLREKKGRSKPGYC